MLPEETFLTDDNTGIDPEDLIGDEQITDPFNPALIRISSRQMTIDLLLARLEHNELDLQPSFQRKGGIWDEGTQSRLVESLLIRIPLQAFYFDGTNEEKWVVVDGLQRLTVLKRFVLEQTLRLRKLEFLTTLEGKVYSDLSRPLQRRINETQVTVYLVEKGTPGRVKFNIFKRINTMDAPLSPQEVRHALNQGKASDMLIRLASSQEFKQATGNSIRDKRMADRECVLRFLAFAITPYTNYKAEEYDSFLSDCMASMNKMPEKELLSLEQRFLRAMKAAYDIFGTDAFRKRGRRSPINKALFESWSVNLDQLSDIQLDLLIVRADKLKERFIDLMGNHDFEESISQGTGHVKKIQRRFSAIKQIIEEVLA